jgi:hypothetical protein
MSAGPRRKPPPPALPLTYFGFAYVALPFALCVALFAPASIAGFFFHARMFAVVHSVTLGWITPSIFGAIYLVAPLALRVELPVTKPDWWVCIGVIVGAVGVIGHFWIGTYEGMVWSGGILFAAFAGMAWRVLRALRESPAPLAVRAHVAVAFVNVMLAGLLGALLALNRVHTVLPGDHIADVFGHAHLAAVGWAALTIFGLGYRLLPMFLPAKPPAGKRLWAALILLETGVLGIALSFLFDHGLVRWCGVVTSLGIAAFLFNMASILRRRVPAPPKLHRPDIGMLQTGFSLLCLLFATGVGLFLAFTEEWRIEWIMVYGVVGLLGFLGQMVLGVGMRLLPMYSWVAAWAAGGYQQLPTSQYEMGSRLLQWATLASWVAGIPLLSYGLASGRHEAIRAGAALLLLGTLAAGVNTVRILRHAVKPPAPDA